MTFFIDLVFSYLYEWHVSLLYKTLANRRNFFHYRWLTAFIFAVQDYSRSDCTNTSPRGGSCKYKRLIEAFTIGAMLVLSS